MANDNIYSETKQEKGGRGPFGKLKIVYAFALVIAIGAALTAKYTSERSLGKIGGSLESDYNYTVTSGGLGLTTKDTKNLTEARVQEIVTNVPDTRVATKEETTEKSKYATPYKDYYTLPMSMNICKEYSGKTPVYSQTLDDWRTHDGVDFSGEAGAQVVAIAYGSVKSVYEDPLFGTTVLIDHGNKVIAKYSGFDKDAVKVKVGDTVKADAVIGYLGEVPCEKDEGSHLHFEISYKGSTVDPLELMGKA